MAVAEKRFNRGDDATLSDCKEWFLVSGRMANRGWAQAEATGCRVMLCSPQDECTKGSVWKIDATRFLFLLQVHVSCAFAGWGARGRPRIWWSPPHFAGSRLPASPRDKEMRPAPRDPGAMVVTCQCGAAKYVVRGQHSDGEGLIFE